MSARVFHPATIEAPASAPPPPGESNGCPGTPTATVSAPALHLSKPTAFYPKGKRFDYIGPGGSPPGSVEIQGRIPPGTFNGVLHGIFGIRHVQIGGKLCLGGGTWQARRVSKGG